MTLSKEQLFAIIEIAEELHAISLSAKTGKPMPGTQDPGRSVEQSITELVFLPTLAFNKFQTINSKRTVAPPPLPLTIADVRNHFFAGSVTSKEVMDEFSLNPDQPFDYNGTPKTSAIDTAKLDDQSAGGARELLKNLCATNFMQGKAGSADYGGPACMKVLMLMAKLGKVIDDRK